MSKFQSTRPARGATDLVDGRCRWEIISIHAPREGRDEHRKPRLLAEIEISIHAPREGRDIKSEIDEWEVRTYFNPRAPRGARPSG